MRTQTTTVKTVNYSIEEINAVAEQLNNLYPNNSDWDPKGTRITGDGNPAWEYTFNADPEQQYYFNFNAQSIEYACNNSTYYGTFNYTEDINDLIKFIQEEITQIEINILNSLED